MMADEHSIDMHTHVFNLRYLPLEGILRSWHVPPLVAKALAKVLNSMTHDASPLAQPAVAKLKLAADAASAMHDLEVVDDDAMLAALSAAAPPELLQDPDVQGAISLNHPKGAMAIQAIGDPKLAAQSLFSSIFDRLRDAVPNPLFETLSELLSWIGLLLEDERTIRDHLFGDFKVDIFVHHMMDMEFHYDPGKCHYHFNNEQLVRMRALVEQSGGRLMTFVAWNPIRPNDLALIQDTVTNGGAIGVKVYPPNGYRASDPVNNPLWQFCVEHDVPVFTHCTPQGFQARPGSGLNSDPKFWATVLAANPKLRLCFGHAGGEAGWFDRFNADEPDFEHSYAKGVIDLCVNNERVYCETGYLSDILDPALAPRFIDRLGRSIAAAPKLADRIMYGTDWHLIAKVNGYRRYTETFRALIAASPIAGIAPKFFYSNAVDFLNLKGFVERQSESDRFDVSTVAPHLEEVARQADLMQR